MLAAVAVTVSDAEALPELLPPGPVDNALAAIELVYVPAAALVTLKIMVHVPFAGMLPPAMVTALAELVNVPDPPLHVVVGAGEVSTVNPAGRVSVKPDCVNA